MIIIRKATLDDGMDFAKLMLTSAPYFPILFGSKIKAVLQDLFYYHFNLFSYEHTYILEIDGERAGMFLGYDWQTKKRENLRTGLLLFKKLGVSLVRKILLLMKFNATVGRLCKGEYYISNIAIYPRYRGRGLGKELIYEVERNARMIGAEKIIFDVEKENHIALAFYKNLDYKIIKEFSIFLQVDKTLNFYRMAKEI